jgi:hypothetical protein
MCSRPPTRRNRVSTRTALPNAYLFLSRARAHKRASTRYPPPRAGRGDWAGCRGPIANACDSSPRARARTRDRIRINDNVLDETAVVDWPRGARSGGS